MKMILALTAFAFAYQAAASDDLTCKSEKGSVLTFSEKYGELRVANSKGKTVVDLDGLTLGKSNFYETYPTTTETDIVYGDDSSETVAKIIKFGKSVKVVIDDVTFDCK